MSPAERGIDAGTILFGKYRIETVLGAGGMGMVYRAHHLALDEAVAIKVLRHDVALDEDTITRFVREAQSAVKLKSEHVARITDVGTFDDGLPYMVMEFLEGSDLGQLVAEHGPMPSTYAVDYLLQACDAIAEAHSLGIVHRDIKPSNLFVSARPDQSMIVKVLDFGISKSASGADLSLTQTSSMLGTPAYMSPEQMRSARTVDARTDVWSLGTVLYELVEGRRPFDADSFSEMCVMVAMDPPAPLRLAPELEPVIQRCLAKKPEQRYANVAELTRDLALYAGNPDAARQYVARTHRVLGLRVPTDSSPSITPPKYTTPLPMPTLASGHGVSAASLSSIQAGSPHATIKDPGRRSSRRVVIALVAAALGVGGALAIIKVTAQDDAPSVEPGAGSTTQPSGAGGVVGDDGSAVNHTDGAGGSATAGVSGAATGVSGAAIDAGTVIATGSDGSGSDRAAGSGSAKTGGRPHKPGGKPPGKPPHHGTGAGSAEPHKGGTGGAEPHAGAGSAEPHPGTGSAEPHPGAGSAEPHKGGTGGTGSATKPCDPFDSRRGC